MGGGFAKKCYEMGGQKIRLEEHISWLASEHKRRVAARDNPVDNNKETSAAETPATILSQEIPKPAPSENQNFARDNLVDNNEETSAGETPAPSENQNFENLIFTQQKIPNLMSGKILRIQPPVQKALIPAPNHQKATPQEAVQAGAPDHQTTAPLPPSPPLDHDTSPPLEHNTSPPLEHDTAPHLDHNTKLPLDHDTATLSPNLFSQKNGAETIPMILPTEIANKLNRRTPQTAIRIDEIEELMNFYKPHQLRVMRLVGFRTCLIHVPHSNPH